MRHSLHLWCPLKHTIRKMKPPESEPVIDNAHKNSKLQCWDYSKNSFYQYFNYKSSLRICSFQKLISGSFYTVYFWVKEYGFCNVKSAEIEICLVRHLFDCTFFGNGIVILQKFLAYTCQSRILLIEWSFSDYSIYWNFMQ